MESSFVKLSHYLHSTPPSPNCSATTPITPGGFPTNASFSKDDLCDNLESILQSCAMELRSGGGTVDVTAALGDFLKVIQQRLRSPPPPAITLNVTVNTSVSSTPNTSSQQHGYSLPLPPLPLPANSAASTFIATQERLLVKMCEILFYFTGRYARDFTPMVTLPLLLELLDALSHPVLVVAQCVFTTVKLMIRLVGDVCIQYDSLPMFTKLVEWIRSRLVFLRLGTLRPGTGTNEMYVTFLLLELFSSPPDWMRSAKERCSSFSTLLLEDVQALVTTVTLGSHESDIIHRYISNARSYYPTNTAMFCSDMSTVAVTPPSSRSDGEGGAGGASGVTLFSGTCLSEGGTTVSASSASTTTFTEQEVMVFLRNVRSKMNDDIRIAQDDLRSELAITKEMVVDRDKEIQELQAAVMLERHNVSDVHARWAEDRSRMAATAQREKTASEIREQVLEAEIRALKEAHKKELEELGVIIVTMEQRIMTLEEPFRFLSDDIDRSQLEY